jgi:protein arginine kinase
MKVGDLAPNRARWLTGDSDLNGTVISCRARLARNVGFAPFSPMVTADDQDRVIEEVLKAAQSGRYMGDATFFKMNALQEEERQLLVERHLISPALAESTGQRGLLFNSDESLSIMINEEDHMRLQAILPGLQADEAWASVNALDGDVGTSLEYAYSDKWGFLTACPTNLGTGLRVSVLVHLPGLVLTDDMDRVKHGLTKMSFAVRGFYGEGSHPLGNLFQISNQATLGVKEQDIINRLCSVTRQIIEYEEYAQQSLYKEAKAQVEDKVWRAFGLLSNARVLSSKDLMALVSAYRLGLSLGIVDHVDTGFVNRLMIETQPSHLQAFYGEELEPNERDVFRAELVRKYFKKTAE